jgi:hypothetical protein
VACACVRIRCDDVSVLLCMYACGHVGRDPRWDKIYGVELYSHHGDGANSFGLYEQENLAYKPEYAQTVLELRAELHSNWQQ